MRNPRKLDAEGLEVESFPVLERLDLPAATPVDGGAGVQYVQPGHTDRSCTYCTLYQLPCC